MGNNKRRSLVLGLLLIGLVSGMVLLGQRQIIKKKAATPTATLTFSPQTFGTIAPGTGSFVTSVVLNTSGQAIVGTDVLVRFDQTKLTLQSITPTTQTILKTFAPIDTLGNLNSARVIACANSGTYNANTANCPSGIGVVEFGSTAFDWTNSVTTGFYNGTTSLATLNFAAKPGTSGSTVVRFVPTSGFTDSGFTATTDSNVVLNSTGQPPQDILANPLSSSVITINIGSLTATNTPIPQATATPIVVPGTTTSIDDSVIGTGQNQFNYVSSGNTWHHCTNCNETNPVVTYYNASQSYSKTANDTFTIAFTGVQIKLYGGTSSWHGIAAVSIDGGAETNVDFYRSSAKAGNVLVYTSPLLTSASHTFKLRVTGTYNSASTDVANPYIPVDRVDVVTSTTTTPIPTTTAQKPGDADCNGIIDARDDLLWFNTYSGVLFGHPTPGPYRCPSNPDMYPFPNGDGVIDARDELVWFIQYEMILGIITPTPVP